MNDESEGCFGCGGGSARTKNFVGHYIRPVVHSASRMMNSAKFASGQFMGIAREAVTINFAEVDISFRGNLLECDCCKVFLFSHSKLPFPISAFYVDYYALLSNPLRKLKIKLRNIISFEQNITSRGLYAY